MALVRERTIPTERRPPVGEVSIIMKENKIIFLLSKFFIYQLMHKRTASKRILKFTLKQLLHVSVQSGKR